MINDPVDKISIYGIKRGLVIDNDDPVKLGRVRVRIYPYFDGVEDSHLPWAKPAFPLTEGSGTNIGYFAVPKIGTWVYTMFEEGDPYLPIVIAEASSGTKGMMSERLVNYPDRKVTRFTSGIVLYVDDAEPEIFLSHPGGASVKINKDGEITIIANDTSIQINGKLDVNVTGNIDMTSGQEINMTSTGNTTIKSTGGYVRVNP